MRLVDASIWIALFRTHHLDSLLKLPDLTITPRVLGQLRGRGDRLLRAVRDAISRGIVKLATPDSAEAADLAWILLAQGGARSGVDEPDAEQVAMVATTPGAVLYMCDWNAQHLSANANVRTYAQLVDDMLALRVVGAREGERILADLRAYWTRR
jgi:hypothetical protein